MAAVLPVLSHRINTDQVFTLFSEFFVVSFKSQINFYISEWKKAKAYIRG